MTAFGLEVTYQDFPDGLRCAECDTDIAWGERYSERFEGLTETNLLPGETVPVCVLVCVPCAMKAALS